jgi:hypothetical protein
LKTAWDQHSETVGQLRWLSEVSLSRAMILTFLTKLLRTAAQIAVQPAAEWFGAGGWRGGTTRLADYLRSHGRPLPVAGSEADNNMISRISLVSLVKG